MKNVYGLSENEGRMMAFKGYRYLISNGRRVWIDVPPNHHTECQPMEPITKERFTICDHHGRYVIDTCGNRVLYGQGAVEALLTGHAWASHDVAVAKLHDARMVAPEDRLLLARVVYQQSRLDPTRMVAVNSVMLPEK